MRLDCFVNLNSRQSHVVFALSHSARNNEHGIAVVDRVAVAEIDNYILHGTIADCNKNPTGPADAKSQGAETSVEI